MDVGEVVADRSLHPPLFQQLKKPDTGVVHVVSRQRPHRIAPGNHVHTARLNFSHFSLLTRSFLYYGYCALSRSNSGQQTLTGLFAKVGHGNSTICFHPNAATPVCQFLEKLCQQLFIGTVYTVRHDPLNKRHQLRLGVLSHSQTLPNRGPRPPSKSLLNGGIRLFSTRWSSDSSTLIVRILFAGGANNLFPSSDDFLCFQLGRFSRHPRPLAPNPPGS